MLLSKISRIISVWPALLILELYHIDRNYQFKIQ